MARALKSEDVLERLSDLFVRRCVTTYIRSDNGAEFTATKVRDWLAPVGVKTLFIEPGSPWENGYVESFNGKLRDELLAREQFDTLLEAKVLIELVGLPSSGAGGNSASEAGWRWGMPNSNSTIGSLPGGRSLATALIAIGLAVLLSQPLAPIKLVSFPLLGAGVLAPFGRPWLGTFAAILIPIGLFEFVIGSWTIFGNPAPESGR